MATSGSADFSVTRNDLIKHALLNIGAIGEGDTPNSTQYTDGAMLLNMIVKARHADGMPLWAIKQTSFPLTASASFTIGTSQTINIARPLKILSAFTRDTAATPDSDLLITVITRDEYEALTAKESTGTPLKLYYDPQGGQTAYGTIYLWPKPDATAIANRTCYIRYQRPFDDFDSSSDTPDFPQEWFLALLWELSWAMAPMYGRNTLERKAFLEEAVRLRNEALLFGMEEGSLYVEPERTISG
jgi:hypothetical protein